MRKILLSLALCLCFSAMYAYVPMLKKGYEWTYMYHESIYYKESWLAYDCYLAFDTILNGYTYYGFKGLSHFGDLDYININFVDLNKYLFREDTVAERVYILERDTKKEFLLYDFSVQAGDSVEVYFHDASFTWISDMGLDSIDDYYREIFDVEGLLATYGNIRDSAEYARLYITDVSTVTDSFGNNIRKYSYYTVCNEYHSDCIRRGVYYERYGTTNEFHSDYNSFKDGACCRVPLRVRCGLDDAGRVGFHISTYDATLGTDCFAEKIINKHEKEIPVPKITVTLEKEFSQQTASPQTEEIKAETLPEENPSKEEETPVEKKSFKSKNLKRCTLGLEKYHSKK